MERIFIYHTILFLLWHSSGIGQNNYILENEYLHVEVSSMGAELQSIFDKKSAREILWIGDSTHWKGQSPVMFPVNVRFKDEKYTYRGREYVMPRMGLAVSNNFTLRSEAHAQKIVLAFTHSQNARSYYPFEFDFEITYHLVDNKLINRFSIENQGSDTMYFALGGHPGFNCPLENGLTRADYEYVFPKQLFLQRTMVENSLVQGFEVPYLQNESRLALADARVPNAGMFLKEHQIKEIGVAKKGEKPFVIVSLGNFPNVNLWSPPGMPFACIEPMVSHHDVVDSPMAIEGKSHLITLMPGESQVYQYAIMVP